MAVTMVSGLIGPSLFSAHLQELLDQGAHQMVDQLEARPADGVWCIAEEGPGAVRCAWMERARVISLASGRGRRFHSLEVAVPAHHVRVLVTARDGEEGCCWIPLDAIQRAPASAAGCA